MIPRTRCLASPPVAGAAETNEANFRSSLRLADAAAVLALALFALSPLRLLRPTLAFVGGALLAASLLRARGFTRPAIALAGGFGLQGVLAFQWQVWPAYFVIPIIIAALTSVAVGSEAELLAAVKPGRLGRAEVAFVLLISATAALALLIWVWALKPELSGFTAMLPSWSVPALVGAGIGFAVINAVLEEVIWRGVFQHWLLSVATAAGAIVIQALSFGGAHYRGFPSGFVGVGLSTLYGLMLGALAFRSRGLLAPIVAHVTADAVIFAIIASSAEAGA